MREREAKALKETEGQVRKEILVVNEVRLGTFGYAKQSETVIGLGIYNYKRKILYPHKLYYRKYLNGDLMYVSWKRY